MGWINGASFTGEGFDDFSEQLGFIVPIDYVREKVERDEDRKRTLAPTKPRIDHVPTIIILPIVAQATGTGQREIAQQRCFTRARVAQHHQLPVMLNEITNVTGLWFVGWAKALPLLHQPALDRPAFQRPAWLFFIKLEQLAPFVASSLLTQG